MSLPTSVFNDNSISFGSRFESIGGTVYSVENITLNYPTNQILRSDPIGQPYGFRLVKGQPTGSCVIQVTDQSGDGGPPAIGGSTTSMPALGAYFVDNFKSASEKWVILSLGTPYEQNGYRKVNANLIQALFSGSS